MSRHKPTGVRGQRNRHAERGLLARIPNRRRPCPDCGRSVLWPVLATDPVPHLCEAEEEAS